MSSCCTWVLRIEWCHLRQSNSNGKGLVAIHSYPSFCMFPTGSDDTESLLPVAVTLTLGPYFISFLLSLLLPNSLLLFSEMFSQTNYLYPVLVLGSASKEKEYKNNWGLFLLQEGFPCDSAGKGFACNAGDLGSIPRLGRSPGEGKGYPFWPGEFHGLYGPWGCKELDITEWLLLPLIIRRNINLLI